MREFKGIFELVKNTFQVFGHCCVHELNTLAGTLMVLLLIELPFWLCWCEWSPLNNNWHILYLWMTTVSNSSTTVINCSLYFLKWQLILSYCNHNFQYIKFQSGKQCLQNYDFNRGNNAALISQGMNFSFSDQIVVSLITDFFSLNEIVTF